jgi:hypothetical protein
VSVTFTPDTLTLQPGQGTATSIASLTVDPSVKPGSGTGTISAVDVSTGQTLAEATLTVSVLPATSTTSPTSPTCLIATAAYGSDLAAPVQFLREFRDRAVSSTYLGSRFLSAFNAWYYSWAPSIARLEYTSGLLRNAVQLAIIPLLGGLIVGKGVFDLVRALNPELAIVLAGFVASSVVGLCYLTPLALLGGRLAKKRITRRTLLCVGISGLLLTLLGTLTHGSTEVIQILTGTFVIEIILVPPTLLAQRLLD